MSDTKVNIELTREEAIVLFEFLARFNEQNSIAFFEDQAEQRVLWDIESALEKSLHEPFRADYSEIVQKARDSVRDQSE